MSLLRRAVNLPALLLIAALLVVWQAAVAWKIIDFTYVPLPTEVLSSLGELAVDGEFYSAVGFTLTNGLIAVAIAVAIALPLGIALATSRLLATYNMASLDLLRHVPLIALMPVALLVWGPTRRSEIILAAFASLWPVLLNVMGGVNSIPPRMMEVSRVFRLSNLDRIRKILMPATLSATVVGVRLAIVVAFLVTLVAEMLVSGNGLGWELVVTQNALNPAKLWALAIVAGVIGYILNVVVERAISAAWPYYSVINANEAA